MMTRNKSKHNDQSNDDAITVADLEVILSKHFEKQKEEFKVEIDRLLKTLLKLMILQKRRLISQGKIKIKLIYSSRRTMHYAINLTPLATSN